MEEARTEAVEPPTALSVVKAEERAGFYRILRDRVTAWAAAKTHRDNKWLEYILIAPDLFHLLCALAFEPEIPSRHKARLGLVIAYFISPIDLMPEALLGTIGLLDDIALTAFFLNELLNKVDPEVVRRHWAGDGDVLERVEHIIAVADEMVGSGLWRRVKSVLGEN